MTPTHRVLVVDDEPAIRTMVAIALEDQGCEVRTAANGHQALDVIATWQPSLTLLDLNMPVLNGYGFAGALREQGTRLRICLMTSDPEAARAAETIGASGILAKPFTIHQLIETVERQCAEDVAELPAARGSAPPQC